jgi:hypothetical protein
MKEFKFKTKDIFMSKIGIFFVMSIEADREIQNYINSNLDNLVLINDSFDGQIGGVCSDLRNVFTIVAGHKLDTLALIELFDLKKDNNTFADSNFFTKEYLFKKEIHNVLYSFDNVFEEIKKQFHRHAVAESTT